MSHADTFDSWNSIQQESDQQFSQAIAQFKKLTMLAQRIHTSQGINQTMAMEAQQLGANLINPKNPIGTYSVLPSKSNLKLSLEEIDKVQAGIIAAIVIATAALIWKFISWIRKKFFGDDSSGGGSGGGGGSGSSDPVDDFGGKVKDADAVKRTSMEARQALKEFLSFTEDTIRDFGSDAAAREAYREKLQEAMGQALNKSNSGYSALIEGMVNNHETIDELRELYCNKAAKNIDATLDRSKDLMDLLKEAADQSSKEALDESTQTRIIEMKVKYEETPVAWDTSIKGPNGNAEKVCNDLKNKIAELKGKNATRSLGRDSDVLSVIDKFASNVVGLYDELSDAMAKVGSAMKQQHADLQRAGKSIGSISKIDQEAFNAMHSMVVTQSSEVKSLIALFQAALYCCTEVTKFLATVIHNYSTVAAEIAKVMRAHKYSEIAKQATEWQVNLRAAATASGKKQSLFEKFLDL